MVLPRGVLNQLKTICRGFLWFGKICHNPGAIAWDKLCHKKKELIRLSSLEY